MLLLLFIVYIDVILDIILILHLYERTDSNVPNETRSFNEQWKNWSKCVVIQIQCSKMNDDRTGSVNHIERHNITTMTSFMLWVTNIFWRCIDRLHFIITIITTFLFAQNINIYTLASLYHYVLWSIFFINVTINNIFVFVYKTNLSCSPSKFSCWNRIVTLVL